jgi:hypothetical protein
MTTVIQFPGRDATPLTATVSGEVRALMGRHGVSQARLGQWLGLHQTALSKRLRGETEWKVSEIDSIAQAFAVHPAALMGGYATDPRPGGPDGGLPILLPRLDSNQQPSDFTSSQVSPLRAA